MNLIMKRKVISTIKSFDQSVSSGWRKLFGEKPALITILFHIVFQHDNEIKRDSVWPDLGLDLDSFRQFIEYFLEENYVFVSPQKIPFELEPSQKYALITFDDGYFNNQHILPLLNEYDVPAIFFISANHVKYNKGFWWDILYRNRQKKGVSLTKIKEETEHLKSMTADQIENYLGKEFSKNALEPLSDIDRPFTPSELKKFSDEKNVFIGNHTSDHAILTNYDSAGVKSQFTDAQETISEMTGILPDVISYPNGNCSEEVFRIAKEVGFRLGITTVDKKNYLPMETADLQLMKLARRTLNGNIKRQCREIQADFSLYNYLKYKVTE